jgi:hypothetical protein
VGLATTGGAAANGLASACCWSTSLMNDTAAGTVFARCGREGARPGGLRKELALTCSLPAGPGSCFAVFKLSHRAGRTACEGGREAGPRLRARTRRISRGDASRDCGHFIASASLGDSSLYEGARPGGLSNDLALMSSRTIIGFAAFSLSQSAGRTVSEGGSEEAARLGERAKRISRGDASREGGHLVLGLASENLGDGSMCSGARPGGMRNDLALTSSFTFDSDSGLAVYHSMGRTAFEGGSEAADRKIERVGWASRGDASRDCCHLVLSLASESLGVSSFCLSCPAPSRAKAAAVLAGGGSLKLTLNRAKPRTGNSDDLDSSSCGDKILPAGGGVLKESIPAAVAVVDVRVKEAGVPVTAAEAAAAEAACLRKCGTRCCGKPAGSSCNALSRFFIVSADFNACPGSLSRIVPIAAAGQSTDFADQNGSGDKELRVANTRLPLTLGTAALLLPLVVSLAGRGRPDENNQAALLRVPAL